MLAKYLRFASGNGSAGHGMFLLGRDLRGVTLRARRRAHITASRSIAFGGPPSGRLNP
jgi:hypothetical protein